MGCHSKGERGVAMKVTTLGIDLAKNVFGVHGLDEQGKAVLKRSVSRALLKPCSRSSS